jgi:chemotaxis protein CheX
MGELIVDIECINPFIEASQIVLKKIANIDAKLGKIFVKDSPYKSDTILVIVGLTGRMRGQTIFSMSVDSALSIASSMMEGILLSKLDEISKSAICELTNMILGNTATILYNNGILIEITPPYFLMGDNMEVSLNKTKTICIPLLLSNGGTIEIDISLEEK